MPLSNVTGAASLSRPGVCTSTTRPASPYDGQMIYETDTDRTLVFDGTTWEVLGLGVYTSSTRPASPFTGQTIFESDTLRVMIWNGSSWVGIAKTDTVQVNSSGVLTASSQPRFWADRNGSLSYPGGGAVVVFNRTQYNVGSHYSTTTGLFTAPVSGNYIFSVGIYQNGSIEQIWLTVNTNRQQSFVLDHTANSANMAGSTIHYLSANDAVGVVSWSGSGARTIYENYYHTYFKGALIS